MRDDDHKGTYRDTRERKKTIILKMSFNSRKKKLLNVLGYQQQNRVLFHSHCRIEMFLFCTNLKIILVESWLYALTPNKIKLHVKFK